MSPQSYKIKKTFENYTVSCSNDYTDIYDKMEFMRNKNYILHVTPQFAFVIFRLKVYNNLLN